jgi:hypothetical protein
MNNDGQARDYSFANDSCIIAPRISKVQLEVGRSFFRFRLRSCFVTSAAADASLLFAGSGLKTISLRNLCALRVSAVRFS